MFVSNACETISQQMETDLARIVFVLTGSHADRLIQELSAISRFEVTDAVVTDPSFAPALHHPQVLFVMEQPMVLFVI